MHRPQQAINHSKRQETGSRDIAFVSGTSCRNAAGTGAHVFVLSVLLIALLATTALAQSRPTVTVTPALDDGSDVLLVIDGNVVQGQSLQLQRGQQVMVWIRDLEKLGWGTVESPQPDRISLRNKSDITLTFLKGQGVAMVNSLSVRLPIDTYMRDGRFMVPLSFVAKALGYEYDMATKPVVTISTTPKASVQITNSNTLRGSVTYNGAGMPGIIVRAVDKSFTVIKDAYSRTDSKGSYAISGLPDGDYMAYVYTGDNPSFFNRASKQVQARGGQVYDLEPIALGRIVAPVTPAVGAKRLSLSHDSVTFKWKPVDGAVRYKLVIKQPLSQQQAYTMETRQPEAHVPTKALRPGLTYEAQVTALDKNDQFLGGTAGTGGTPWTFTTSR